MKKVFVILLLTTSCAAYAQKISLRSIGISFSSDKLMLPDRVNLHDFYGYSVLEPSGNNFSANINAEIRLLSRLSLRTGVGYSNKDYTGYFGCASCYYEYDWIDAMPMASPTTIHQRYLDVPVLARFYFIDKRFGFFGDAGFSGNFLIENDTDSDNGDLGEVRSNNFILNGQAGVGVSYTFAKYFEVSLTAVYRNSLTTYIATDDMQLRSFGATAGVAYKFR